MMIRVSSAPKLFKPMLAHALPAGKSIKDYADGNHVLEQKYDGHRLLITVNSSTTVHAYSRGGKTRTLPHHILEAFTFIPPGTYDGELLVPGGTSTDVTSLHLLHSLELRLFDILSIGNEKCMHVAGEMRRALLVRACSLLPKDSCIMIAKQFEVTASELQRIWDFGGEGAIVKHKDQPYLEGKRPHGWIKFKKQAASEVTITDFESGQNGPHSIIVCEDDDGIAVRVKTRDTSWLKKFELNAASYLGRRLTISYQQRTAEGKYRHPMADHIIGD